MGLGKSDIGHKTSASQTKNRTKHQTKNLTSNRTRKIRQEIRQKIGLKIEQNRTNNWTRKVGQKNWTVKIGQEIKLKFGRKIVHGTWVIGLWTSDIKNRTSNIRHWTLDIGHL